MNLRPDELANIAEEERDARVRGRISAGIGAVTSLGAAAGGAISAGVVGKIAPFLNKYIPVDLAIKGISKVSPKLGAFLQDGLSKGLDAKEGLAFIKEKAGLGGEKREEPKKEAEKKNIVEMYSPELHQFILDQMNQGRSPLEAGALASLEKKGQKDFKKIIKKIEGDHKAPWSAILQTVYGQGEKAQQPQQQAQQQKPLGQGQAALMAILQKLQQARESE